MDHMDNNSLSLWTFVKCIDIMLASIITICVRAADKQTYS